MFLTFNLIYTFVLKLMNIFKVDNQMASDIVNVFSIYVKKDITGLVIFKQHPVNKTCFCGAFLHINPDILHIFNILPSKNF